MHKLLVDNYEQHDVLLLVISAKYIIFFLRDIGIRLRDRQHELEMSQ